MSRMPSSVEVWMQRFVQHLPKMSVNTLNRFIFRSPAGGAIWDNHGKTGGKMQQVSLQTSSPPLPLQKPGEPRGEERKEQNSYSH